MYTLTSKLYMVVLFFLLIMSQTQTLHVQEVFTLERNNKDQSKWTPKLTGQSNFANIDSVFILCGYAVREMKWSRLMYNCNCSMNALRQWKCEWCNNTFTTKINGFKATFCNIYDWKNQITNQVQTGNTQSGNWKQFKCSENQFVNKITGTLGQDCDEDLGLNQIQIRCQSLTSPDYQIVRQGNGDPSAKWSSNPAGSFVNDLQLKIEPEGKILGFKAYFDSLLFDSRFNFLNLANIPGGYGFIELGAWRFGAFNDDHFSFTHKSGFTSIIYRSDGLVFNGPRTDFNLWSRPLLENPVNVIYGDRYVQFGKWRIAQVNPQHLSLSHSFGKTSMIWRCDGLRFPGPRDDWNGWGMTGTSGKALKYGKNILQIGNFRIGDFDGKHMSIGSTMTIDIYRDDGTVYAGPRFDFNHFFVDI